MEKILIFLLVILTVFLSGCFGGEDPELIVRKSPELISRWENDVQPGIDSVLIERSQISKVTGEYSLDDQTVGDYKLLKITDKSGGYIARVEVYNFGQVNVMPYELTWEGRTGKPLFVDGEDGDVESVSVKTSSDEFVDMFFVGDM